MGEGVWFMSISNKTKEENKFRRNILIDLDGVLNCYCGEYDEEFIPEVREGAREFVERLYSLGRFNLVLFTTRNLLLVSRWLVDSNLYSYFSNITNVKLPAFLCIDDRVLTFRGNFNDMYEEIVNFRPYWKG